MATAKKSSAKSPRASSGRKGSGKQESASRPIRREVGAAICLLLAFFAAFGYFNIHALFIDFFVGLLKGLFGYGFWITPPALLAAGLILAFHRGRPVALRLCCALLFPLILGSILHLAILKDLPGAAVLWSTGRDMSSGGLFSGLLATGLVYLFSRVGAMVILIVAALLMAAAVSNLSVTKLVQALRSRPKYEPEEEPERTPRPAREKRRRERRSPRQQEPLPEREDTGDLPRPSSRRVRSVDIDIPVDDPPMPEPPAPEPTPPKKKKLFRRESEVKTPDQVLAEQEEQPPEPPAPQEPPAPLESKAPPKVKPEEAAQAAAEVTQEIEQAMDQETAAYQYPPVSLLLQGEGAIEGEAFGELQANRTRLDETMRSFGIDAKICNVTRGPSVTRYEVELDQGVRLNKLTNLADDIALALGASGVRIAPIPDKISIVGIEVPNKLVSPVYIHDVLDSPQFRNHPSKVAFALGKDIGGNCIVGDIARLPHLLIAGTTGSGKSVCTNSLIISLLYKSTPEEVRLIMVDPKMVELGIYNGIPHLLIPVVTDPKKAAGALQWAVTEMLKRYREFSQAGVRDLKAYNAFAAQQPDLELMPQIVVVIDELADLMLVAAKEVEESICRVAQMGRAAGMHLVIATQRPSSDVITGLMKANIPSRIAFAVASALESRIILDTMGAEKLVGRGDMLYAPLGAGKPTRVQGCLISDQEVADVVEFIKRSGEARYDSDVLHEIELHAAEKDKGSKGVGGSAPAGADSEYDELLPSAVEVVLEMGQASVSMLQRRLKLGYSRAARMVDQMEELGVVGPFEGSKARQILITKEEWQQMQLRRDLNDPPAAVEPVPEEFPFEGDAVEQERDAPPF